MRLRFLPSRSWRRTHLTLKTKGVAPEAPPPQPRELIDVVGLGVTGTVGGVALTLLSVERYREGYVALFRLFRTRGPLEMDFPSPHLDLTVTPDDDVPYRFWMMGGSGGGMRELEYRQSYAIVPAPPADAVETVIEVREISWKRYGAGTYRVVSVDKGPWRFRIGR